jgi:hypothetical protein
VLTSGATFGAAEGWVNACGRAVLWSPDMDRILAGAGAVRDVASMIA